MNWCTALTILQIVFTIVNGRNLEENTSSLDIVPPIIDVGRRSADTKIEYVRPDEHNVSQGDPQKDLTFHEHSVEYHFIAEPESELLPSHNNGYGTVSDTGNEIYYLYNMTSNSPEADTDDNSTRIISRKKRIIPIMFARIEKNAKTNGSVDECIGNPEDEFPDGLFTLEERKNGALVVSVFIGIYCFTLLALVCDNYFLPSVECICENLNLSPDVAAATFMAIATSAPELFVNIIGTFVTHSDIGIGTVVGSSMFNGLGVAGLGGLACSTRYIQIDWWPLTRDCILYVLSISVLVFTIWDGKVMWYEGLIMFIMYFLYFVIMFNNRKIRKLFMSFVNKKRPKVVPDNTPEKQQPTQIVVTSKPPISTISSNNNTVIDGEIIKRYVEYNSGTVKEEQILGGGNNAENEEVGSCRSLCQLPQGHWLKKIFFIYSWPIKVCLFCTIPDCRRYPKVFPFTFLVCILWIGINSYMVSWMITIFGNTLNIPAAVLGLTFLAAGGCLPEAISIFIMARRGQGSMGVSNSLGANTMNILLSLGMPWFVKTISMGATTQSFIEIQSGKIQYTILALILVAILLYVTLYLKKFRLSRSTGGILMAIYFAFLLVAILLETIFSGGIDIC